jgi:hypothetical protein
MVATTPLGRAFDIAGEDLDVFNSSGQTIGFQFSNIGTMATQITVTNYVAFTLDYPYGAANWDTRSPGPSPMPDE